MKRILLDTNVYGRLMEDKEFFLQLLALVPSFFVVYGAGIIRQELRDISKKAKFQGKSKRTFVLSIYDALIRNQFRTPEFYKYESFKRYIGGNQLR